MAEACRIDPGAFCGETTNEECARNYGRAVRAVFAGEDWSACEAYIQRGWNQVSDDMPWQAARPLIQDGWRQGAD